MSISVDGTNGVTYPDLSVQNTAATGFGFKNRIINGACVIDQRNAGASVTITAASAAQYVLDRFYLRAESAAGSKVSVQRSTTAPTGFINSQLITSLSAYTIGAAEHFATVQFIEGFNIADLGWGTASAQTVTISFKVRSSLTGTFGGILTNSAGNRSYVFSYTINAANTFEDKSVTIVGDTTGTWLTDNGGGIAVAFSVGAGSSTTAAAGSWGSTLYRSVTGQTSLVGTSGATFYITGVQLEKGSTATSFDYRPYGTELALCQRYLPIIQGSSNGYHCMGYAQSSSQANLFYPFKVTPRTPPTGITVFNIANFGATTQASGGGGTSASFTSASIDGCNFALNTGGSYVTNAALFMYSTNANAQMQFTGCEL